MFGDDYMAFRQYAAIDSKYRLKIPSQTGVEKGEKLYLLYNCDKTHLVLSKAKTLIEKIERLEEECGETEDTERYKKLSRDKEYYCSLIIQVFTVDQEKRILLGRKNKDLIGNNPRRVFLSGQMNEIGLFNDEEECRKIYEKTI